MGAAVGDGLAEGDRLEDRAVDQPPAPAANTATSSQAPQIHLSVCRPELPGAFLHNSKMALPRDGVEQQVRCMSL